MRDFLVLTAYLGIVYVPFVPCLGIIWVAGAAIWRKSKGDAWQTAIPRAAKEAAVAVLIGSTALLFLGLMTFLIGF